VFDTVGQAAKSFGLTKEKVAKNLPLGL
jgi:hypothetical protein